VNPPESAKQRAFLEHPDALTDPVKAAMDVGYSESTARARSYELRDKHLPELVEKMRARLENLAVTPDWLKNEIKIIADTAMADFVEFVEDAQGAQWVALKSKKDLDLKKWRAAIKEVKLDTFVDAAGKIRSRICEIKLYDRQAALVELGNLMGLKNEKLLMALQSPDQDVGDEHKLMEYMTTEDLEIIAEIQERAAARMKRQLRDKISDRRAIDSTSEPAGSKNHSASSGPRTSQKRKTRRLPPPSLPPED
jgi:hypothetical protein